MTTDHAVRPVGDPAVYRARKAQLVGALRGRVLELGAGAGANFPLLDPHVDWVGIEPSARRRNRLQQRWPGRSVLDASAERLPFPDASLDAVLATVVLCSVSDQARVLDEVVRVLRPGGRFVFFEHVASPPGTWNRRWQGLLAPFSRVLDAGCDPTRQTWQALERVPWHTLDLRWYAGGWPQIGGVGVA